MKDIYNENNKILREILEDQIDHVHGVEISIFKNYQLSPIWFKIQSKFKQNFIGVLINWS